MLLTAFIFVYAIEISASQVKSNDFWELVVVVGCWLSSQVKYFNTDKRIVRFAKNNRTAARKAFCLIVYFFSPSLKLSNIVDRAPRLHGGGAVKTLSKLTRVTSSCLSRRVVLITRVIEVFCSSMEKSLLWLLVGQ
jgi:hypothetical protein